MTARDYEQLIAEGIQGLPETALEEIAELILLLRRKFFRPDDFKNELRAALLASELRQASRGEQAHLEEEFKDYDERYPRE